MLFGVDNNLLSRVLEGDLFEEYESPALESVDPQYAALDRELRTTPIDHGDVYLNYDRAWFAAGRLAPRSTLDDLADPGYEGLLVVENPATSTPGLAFLLATVARYGETVGRSTGGSCVRTRCTSSTAGRRPTRRVLRRRRAREPADRRLVCVEPARRGDLPHATAEGGTDRRRRGRLLPPGRVRRSPRGARNAEGAQKLVDFMLSRRFQEDVPL